MSWKSFRWSSVVLPPCLLSSTTLALDTADSDRPRLVAGPSDIDLSDVDVLRVVLFKGLLAGVSGPLKWFFNCAFGEFRSEGLCGGDGGRGLLEGRAAVVIDII